MKKKIRFMLLFFTFISFMTATVVRGDTISKPYTFSNGTIAEAGQVNDNFDTVYNQVNKIGGTITVDSNNNVLSRNTQLQKKITGYFKELEENE